MSESEVTDVMGPSVSGIAITRMTESHECFNSDGDPILNNFP
jgi:hypothetical protein